MGRGGGGGETRARGVARRARESTSRETRSRERSTPARGCAAGRDGVDAEGLRARVAHRGDRGAIRILLGG